LEEKMPDGNPTYIISHSARLEELELVLLDMPGNHKG